MNDYIGEGLDSYREGFSRDSCPYLPAYGTECTEILYKKIKDWNHGWSNGVCELNVAEQFGTFE